MKKGTFIIRTFNGFKEVDGYIHQIETLKFGFYKHNNEWIVTELYTGCALSGSAKTRKDALEHAEEDYKEIFDTIASNNEQINKMYEELKEYKKTKAEQEGEKEMKQTKKGVKKNMGMTFENTGETVEIQSIRVKGLSRNNIKRLEKKEKTAHWERNEEHKGIEITFKEKPEKSIRDMLKKVGFRWHNAKKLWYAKENEAVLKVAETICA